MPNACLVVTAANDPHRGRSPALPVRPNSHSTIDRPSCPYLKILSTDCRESRTQLEIVVEILCHVWPCVRKVFGAVAFGGDRERQQTLASSSLPDDRGSSSRPKIDSRGAGAGPARPIRRRAPTLPRDERGRAGHPVGTMSRHQCVPRYAGGRLSISEHSPADGNWHSRVSAIVEFASTVRRCRRRHQTGRVGPAIPTPHLIHSLPARERASYLRAPMVAGIDLTVASQYVPI